mgnify:CR=1 FL=1
MRDCSISDSHVSSYDSDDQFESNGSLPSSDDEENQPQFVGQTTG